MKQNFFGQLILTKFYFNKENKSGGPASQVRPFSHAFAYLAVTPLPAARPERLRTHQFFTKDFGFYVDNDNNNHYLFRCKKPHHDGSIRERTGGTYRALQTKQDEIEIGFPRDVDFERAACGLRKFRKSFGRAIVEFYAIRFFRFKATNGN
jgi:hypothetical protein